MKLLNPFASLPDNLLTRALKDGTTPLAFAGGFSLISNLLYLALPLYTFQIYGRVLASYSIPTLVVLTVGAVLVFLISGVIDELRTRVLINYGITLDQKVSSHVFAALFEAETRGQGQGRSQALRDLDSFRQLLTGTVFSAIFDLPWMPIFIGILFVIDPLVGFITLFGAIALLGLAFLQDRLSRPPLQEANEAAIKGYAFTEATLRNSEVVRAMGMLQAIGARWSIYRVRAIERGAWASQRASVMGNATKFTRMFIQILVIGVGAYLVVVGKIGPAMLFANMILASRALQPIEKVVGAWDGIVNGGRAYDRLNLLLNNYRPAAPSTTLPRPLGQLSIEGVNFAPPGADRYVLQGLNFKIEPGEVLGVIGPSGAGKSTLARLMVGVWRPTNGNVRLDGADVFSWNRAEFGRHVGYLPQDTELFAGTLRDNIARFLPDVTDEAVVAAATLADVHALILRLPKGYETELTDGGYMLSAGQRQRVGLARALLGNPRLLVLDEPNASLDAEGEDALMRVIDLLKAQGTTIVVVSHKPAILRAADKMLVMRDGRMELFGPKDAVMARFAQSTPVRPVEAGQ
ncbi:MAG: type I secretion system permease/ATPase [Phenylobacterium sp.]|uniref:type I secretion system permease/ATPase n=1 Tax=Phenylobacterium sp. TaxID=1871053 RepID=UPI002724A0DB|nr:type I secretion system permease/ATPase [Phenylobacterium sp.]MDO8900634.1 type I secretion system permease/ATPase [Phenylobacterium sp.]MDP2214881.1 type I secretion system permease/ATPase [Phenylobacterium sp.]